MTDTNEMMNTVSENMNNILLSKSDRIKAAQKKLAVLQQQVKQLGIPVIILFEGWGASGKGQIISQLIDGLDPRNFKVYTIGEPNEDEKRRPIMWRYWNK
nr:phosphate--AMP phosphotransferase [Clostridia bacterium]